MNSLQNNSNYIPKTIDTSNIDLNEELLELLEILSKNVHDNWALERLNDGWKYGSERNDEKKEHPCLIPYEELTENEKEYDRNTAIQTLKVVISLGYQIIKV